VDAQITAALSAKGWKVKAPTGKATLIEATHKTIGYTAATDYIKLAHLKGLPPRVVIFKHAFRNALIPVLTLAGINFVIMVNAAVVVEVIFAWPGVGHLLYEGISQRDFPLVQGVVLMGGVMIVLTNLGVDLLYAWVDPRIRVTR